MNDIARRLDSYIQAHPFNCGDSDCDTVLDQLYRAAQFASTDCPFRMSGVGSSVEAVWGLG